ncbi:RNAse HI domain-containing protein, partial [Burkholderia contaminans]|nr:RNAse HI domain-containing protein [Burkholderia contaminans]
MKENNNRSRTERVTWYTDGSKTQQGTGAGIYNETEKLQYSIPLGKYTSVFQAEVYAILHCAKENITRSYTNKRIDILSDSQAALKAITNPKVTSRLVWECQRELTRLADHNKVTLTWVPGHTGIEGNEKADELARQGSSTPFTGAEPALGIPKSIVRGQIGEWVRNRQNEYWNSISRQRHGKMFIKGTCEERTEELLKMNRI